MNTKKEEVENMRKTLMDFTYNKTSGDTPSDRENYWTNDLKELDELGGGNVDYWTKNTKMPFGAQCSDGYQCLSNCCNPDPTFNTDF